MVNQLFPADVRVNFFHDALRMCLNFNHVPCESWESAEDRILGVTDSWRWHHTRGLTGTLELDGELCKFVTNLPLVLNSDPNYIKSRVEQYIKSSKVMGPCNFPDSDRTAIVNANGKRDVDGNLLCSIRPLFDWNKFHQGNYSFDDDTLNHPIVEPVFGTLERARRYFDALLSRGHENIGIFFNNAPVGFARPFGFGNSSYNYIYCISSYGFCDEDPRIYGKPSKN